MKRSTAKSKADRLFSQHIRTLGQCEHCGATSDEAQLQCAHWISRTYSHTRVDPDNAFCLCAACHHWFGKHPTAFSDWAIAKRGRDVYERLFEASQNRTAVDWFAQVALLEQLVKQEGPKNE